MDIEKTKQYYDQLTDDDICSCAYCRNYVREIKTACPELAAYLGGFGVSIEKPFETIPIGPVEGIMIYAGVQYVIIGTADDFTETGIGNARVLVTDSHPMTEIKENHFVIEISPVYLPWTGDRELSDMGDH